MHTNAPMPEGYDTAKEPIAPFRLRREVRAGSLSGNGYVVALLKGDRQGGKVSIASEAHCEHGITICDQKVAPDGGLTCSESWQLDYSILWSRTKGGRELLTKLGGPKADKHQNSEHPAAIHARQVAEATKD